MGNLTKVSNDTSRFADQEADYDERLDFYDPKKNNNKFWHIRVFGRYIVRNYGRQGTPGQTVVHQAYSTWDAREEADKLYWKKKDKGYVKDKTTVLDHIARKLG